MQQTSKLLISIMILQCYQDACNTGMFSKGLQYLLLGQWSSSDYTFESVELMVLFLTIQFLTGLSG